MSDYLTTAKQRERDSRAWRAAGVPRPTDRHSRAAHDAADAARARALDRAPDLDVSAHLSGAALAHECERAATIAGKRAKISDSERDALAAMLAERIARKGARRGRPREVLGWIDRAERMPTIAAREAAQVERGRAGRAYLLEIAAGLLAHSREWRDVAESYGRASRAQRDNGPMVRVEAVDVLAEGTSDLLALALARDAVTVEVAPLPDDLRDVARAMAAKQADATDAERRRILAALLHDLARVPLLAVAAECGYTVKSAKQSASTGRALLAARYPDPADLAADVRRTASALGLVRRVRLDVPDLTPAERAARAAVERGTVGAAAWTRTYLEGQRGTYSPATLRAARRNLRADLRTGRYGRALPPSRAGRAPSRIWGQGPRRTCR